MRTSEAERETGLTRAVTAETDRTGTKNAPLKGSPKGGTVMPEWQAVVTHHTVADTASERDYRWEAHTGERIAGAN